MSQYRTCTRCSETKPIDDFYPLFRGLNRRRAACKACELKARAKNRAENYERDYANLVEWRKLNKDKVKVINARAYLKRKARLAQSK